MLKICTLCTQSGLKVKWRGEEDMYIFHLVGTNTVNVLLIQNQGNAPNDIFINNQQFGAISGISLSIMSSFIYDSNGELQYLYLLAT